MNYRHHFHAGNFADIVKHAILLAVMARMTGRGAALEVVDSHAGAGIYDLTGEAAQRSGEAAAGIGRLMGDPQAPAVFDGLKQGVRALNQGGPVRLYPGSPWLAARALRPGDAYTGYELRPDDQGALEQALAGREAGPALRVQQADGFEAAISMPAQRPRTLLLIDPPYERGDDYPRIAQTLDAVLDRRPALVAAIWAPIKDLETLDALLRRLDGLGFASGVVAETRLRPLVEPMRLNGCAVILLASQAEAAVLEGMEAAAQAACDWTARAAGEAGGQGRVEAWAG